MKNILSKQRIESKYYVCEAKLECGHVARFEKWPLDWEVRCWHCDHRDLTANECLSLAWADMKKALRRWWKERVVDRVDTLLYRPSLRENWIELPQNRRRKIVSQVQTALSEWPRVAARWERG